MKPFTSKKSTTKPGGSVLSPAAAPKKSKKSEKPQRAKTVTGEGTIVQSWASDAGRFVVYGLAVLVALGALCGFLAFNRPAPQVQKTAEVGNSVQKQQTGAFAQAYLAAWLSATSNDHDELDHYIDGSNVVGNTPSEYRDMTVASIEAAPGNLSTVVVSASLKNTVKDDKGKETTSWIPSWYQVVVQSKEGAMAPAGLPAPIAVPAIGSTPQLGYPSRVTNKEIQATVADFMTAYLTGQGDVTRYVSPETNINAITPAYWTQAKVKTIQSGEEISDKTPANGQDAEILINMNLTHDTSTKPAQYVLTLKVRDGRWEIQALNLSPALSR